MVPFYCLGDPVIFDYQYISLAEAQSLLFRVLHDRQTHTLLAVRNRHQSLFPCDLCLHCFVGTAGDPVKPSVFQDVLVLPPETGYLMARLPDLDDLAPRICILKYFAVDLPCVLGKVDAVNCLKLRIGVVQHYDLLDMDIALPVSNKHLDSPFCN